MMKFEMRIGRWEIGNEHLEMGRINDEMKILNARIVIIIVLLTFNINFGNSNK